MMLMNMIFLLEHTLFWLFLPSVKYIMMLQLFVFITLTKSAALYLKQQYFVNISPFGFWLIFIISHDSHVDTFTKEHYDVPLYLNISNS